MAAPLDSVAAPLDSAWRYVKDRRRARGDYAMTGQDERRVMEGRLATRARAEAVHPRQSTRMRCVRWRHRGCTA